jgi:hypothetical protein
VDAALASLGMSEMYGAWGRVADSRNKFVHGTPPGDMFK